MYISEYDFEKISTHKKTCVVYGESGNDVREVAKDLYPMEIVMNCTKLMGFYIEVIENDDNYIEYRVWSDLGDCCINFIHLHQYNVLSHDFDIERDTKCLLNVLLKYKGMKGFRNLIKDDKDETGWIPKTYLYALKVHG